MNTRIRLLATTAVFGLLVTLAAPALAAGTRFKLDPSHTRIRITWNHLGFSNPGATFNISEGMLTWNGENPARSSVTVTIPVASVDTRVPALDARFKSQFFDVDEYPTITFESTKVDRIGHSDHYRVTGDLTVRGITESVTLRVTLNKIGMHALHHKRAIGFDATATLKRTAFGIDAYVPAVSDLVRIHITTEAIAVDSGQSTSDGSDEPE